MQEKETIQHYMEELGPLLKLRGVYQHNDTAFSVFVEDSREIWVNWHEQTRQLVFSCDLPIPDNIDKAVLYEFILTFNVLWMENKFSRFGLMKKKNTIEFAQHCPTAQLSLSVIGEFCLAFHEHASYWANRLADQKLWRSSEEMQTQALFHDSQLIKV